jgi:hypothetical protein
VAGWSLGDSEHGAANYDAFAYAQIVPYVCKSRANPEHVRLDHHKVPHLDGRDEVDAAADRGELRGRLGAQGTGVAEGEVGHGAQEATVRGSPSVGVLLRDPHREHRVARHTAPAADRRHLRTDFGAAREKPSSVSTRHIIVC